MAGEASLHNKASVFCSINRMDVAYIVIKL